MANEVADPLEFKSWEDAFQYPIPTVRKLEQQLRNHADENREQLRTLVGVSYRDLLGTAERIIEMDTQMQKVEVILSQTGQKCNARAISKMSKSFGKLQGERSSRSLEQNSLASQLAVLECCPIVITRILKQKGSLLLAAKLLLLSRLTHKTLSQHAEAPPLVNTLRDRLASLRRKLLRAIDARFSDPERDVGKLVDDMCAFSLAMSSTPTDVLRHFHHIRLQSIRWHLEQASDIKAHAIKTMQLLLGTLHCSQLIFPKRLSDSLVRLKDQPLIQQSDIQSVSELNLRIHARWLADDLQSYTPWPRHDELQKLEADKILKTWAKSAQKVFIAGLKTAFAQQSIFEDVLAIRKELFQAWPWTDNRLPGLHSADVVDELREAFNDRLSKIIASRVTELKLVCESAHKVINEMGPSFWPELALWDSSVVETEVTGGAQEFKAVILSRYNGTDESISKVIAVYDRWVESINAIELHLKEMKETRWDDDFAEDLDDLDSRQTLLSEDDPRALNESLSSTLDAEAEALLADFTELSLAEVSNENKGAKAIVLLRVLREISKRAAVQDRAISAVALPLTTSAKVIQPLHSSVASAALTTADTGLSKSLSKFAKSSTVVGRILWEGSPQLPIQPSALAFKFLKALTTGMAGLGGDLWSGGAVDAVKIAAREAVASQVAKAASEITSNVVTAVNGHGKHNTDEDESNDMENEQSPKVNSDSAHFTLDEAASKQVMKDKLKQITLDLHYLQSALYLGPQARSPTDNPLSKVFEQITTAADLDQSEVARLQKSAADYWKRTYLLFALLAK